MTHTVPYASSPLGAAFPRAYPGAVMSVTDGDTLVMLLDRGGDDWWRVSVRLDGVNARELTAPGGREARQHLAGLVAPVSPVSLAELFDGRHTATVRSLRYDKYSGRIDARVLLPDGRDVAQQMVADGFAAAWDGRGPRPVPPWPQL